MLTLGQEKAVYSILLPEVKKQLDSITLSSNYVHTADKDKLDALRTTVEGKFRHWVADIVDLAEFPYGYPVNGATHGIDYWLLANASSAIQQGPGEYDWARIQRPDIEITTTPSTRAYISNPYSATGNFDHRHLAYNVPMLLDCAFVGTTRKQKIELPDSVEAVTFSLSKGFSLNLFRSGFIFSKQPIKSLETLSRFNYFNYPALVVADVVLSNFEVDYVYNKLRPIQEDICYEYRLTASDCVFLATSSDPMYDHWKRGDGTNRLCLSREYAKRGLGSFDLGDSN